MNKHVKRALNVLIDIAYLGVFLTGPLVSVLLIGSYIHLIPVPAFLLKQSSWLLLNFLKSYILHIYTSCVVILPAIIPVAISSRIINYIDKFQRLKEIFIRIAEILKSCSVLIQNISEYTYNLSISVAAKIFINSDGIKISKAANEQGRYCLTIDKIEARKGLKFIFKYYVPGKQLVLDMIMYLVNSKIKQHNDAASEESEVKVINLSSVILTELCANGLGIYSMIDILSRLKPSTITAINWKGQIDQVDKIPLSSATPFNYRDQPIVCCLQANLKILKIKEFKLDNHFVYSASGEIHQSIRLRELWLLAGAIENTHIRIVQTPIEYNEFTVTEFIFQRREFGLGASTDMVHLYNQNIQRIIEKNIIRLDRERLVTNIALIYKFRHGPATKTESGSEIVNKEKLPEIVANRIAMFTLPENISDKQKIEIVTTTRNSVQKL